MFVFENEFNAAKNLQLDFFLFFSNEIEISLKHNSKYIL